MERLSGSPGVAWMALHARVWERGDGLLGTAKEMYSISKGKPSRASLSLSFCYQVVCCVLCQGSLTITWALKPMVYKPQHRVSVSGAV